MEYLKENISFLDKRKYRSIIFKKKKRLVNLATNEKNREKRRVKKEKNYKFSYDVYYFREKISICVNFF